MIHKNFWNLIPLLLSTPTSSSQEPDLLRGQEPDPSEEGRLEGRMELDKARGVPQTEWVTGLNGVGLGRLRRPAPHGWCPFGALEAGTRASLRTEQGPVLGP